ncbi:RNA polymerase-associated protein RapA [Isoalcanivorax indicus]|uniref:RNA polymerase-associated protein RapA n=1 Tax=Isoalcanivorax indicus TaxID=2202653 RepID=UPI000DB905D0|nr:RNA polymerase-associated protein RapA [Isoalcanivorax indicus]
MTDFAIGQRWLSETETELGLGIIVNLDYRLVTVFYPACEEERTYAKNNAPLSRMTFGPGDQVHNTDGEAWLVQAAEEVDGLMVYKVTPVGQPDAPRILPESQLGYQVALTAVTDRLFSKQLDSNAWFALRAAALNAESTAEQSPVQGLRGPRIELIGHQLSIADDVAQRFAPRVLLADEVGLGKTIEAGLIIHQQLHTHRAQRVLIVVPPPLVHQWFVEMVRRFNLHFSIFDRERLAALQPEGDLRDMLAQIIAEENGGADDDAPAGITDNPFLSEQLILCSTDFLEACDMDALAAADWDLLVVDEAHHLTWSEAQASEGYLRVERLAAAARGLLLLTATPEQLGQESHFARLRLLDPDRFHSLADFLEEQQHWQAVAAVAGRLHDEPRWDDALRQDAARYLPDLRIEEDNRDALLRELLDRSGTSRVMFRNTRKTVSGFPARQVTGIPLPWPAQYGPVEAAHMDPDDCLHPESGYADDSWCAEDSRVTWLADFLRQQRDQKVLIICARRETAIDLHAWCGYKLGMNVSVFHEDMDLISRDRAAAYFADLEDGAQALICSEIGSEGRNFQFAHQLVLMDLPRNPDLLEQRIGRLDRIGQQQDIRIHVPYFRGHAQEVLFRWYDEGMHAFTRTNPAGPQILAETANLLDQALATPQDSTLVDDLIETTQTVTRELLARMEAGRDRLLELGAHDPVRAERLIADVAAADADSPAGFMEAAFERYGVDVEEHSAETIILKPGAHMVGPFPRLPEEGTTVTSDRRTALARDDIQFLTWEHPMVTGTLEMVLGEDKGKACVALLRNRKVKPGTLLVEVFYRLSCVAPRALQANRFLPSTIMRGLIDAQGRDLSQAISHGGLDKQCHKLDKPLARKIVESQQALLARLLDEDLVRREASASTLIDEALARMHAHQTHERDRLLRLREKNPAIRQDEIDFIDEQTRQLARHIGEARCELAAVRVIVAGE